jgi:hypothetical protein
MIVIILSIIVGALGYACYNLLEKQEVYEDWVELFRSEVGQMYGKLKEVDDKELFCRDDDVGFVYSEILRVVKEFNDKIQ